MVHIERNGNLPSGSEKCGSYVTNRTIRVGYAFMPKKMESMEKIIHALSLLHSNIVYKPLDLNRELTEQGNFDVILHKLSEDIMNRSLSHHSNAKLSRIDRYLTYNRSCICLDKLDEVAVVINRVSTLEVLEKAYLTLGASSGMPKPPRYIVIGVGVTVPEIRQRVREAGFRYPLICKPIQACGTLGSHTMLVILDENSLSAVAVPIVIQEYYNHDSILFKVCVVGDFVQMHSRVSLPNLSPGLSGSLSFDSQKPYPTAKDFGGHASDESSREPPQLPFSVAHDAACRLREVFSLSLFGFDLIVNHETKEVVIIDVNYFPSFRNFVEFPKALSEVIRRSSDEASDSSEVCTETAFLENCICAS